MWPITPYKKNLPARRSFGGAQLGRLAADWFISNGSQDAEIRSSLTLLRNRSRQMGRDVDYMKNYYGLLQDNVVGCGIPFKAQVKMQRKDALDLKTNAQIEAAWARWSAADSCHTAGTECFEGIQRLLIKTLAEDGEFFVRKVYRKFGVSRVPLALELIESERLDENYNLRAKGNDNEIRMGVEIDSWKRPVAYHFLSRSPGDLNGSTVETMSIQRIRVPANEIIHGFIPDRIGQTRGVPWLHAAIMRLHNLSKYEEAEVIGARIGASGMGFIETPEEESSLDDDVEDGQSVTDFEPGVFKKLNPGEKVSIPNISRPANGFEAFVRLALRGVAAGLGVSYESLSRDYSQTNYSSARQGMLTDRDRWKALQGWFLAKFNQAVFDDWLDQAVLFGELDLTDYLNGKKEFYQGVKWKPRGWGWVDPQKEVAANKDAVRSGFRTQASVIAETGGDYDEFMSEREHEVKAANDAKLVFDTDPAQVTDKGQSQQALSGGAAGGDPNAPANA